MGREHRKIGNCKWSDLLVLCRLGTFGLNHLDCSVDVGNIQRYVDLLFFGLNWQNNLLCAEWCISLCLGTSSFTVVLMYVASNVTDGKAKETDPAK